MKRLTDEEIAYMKTKALNNDLEPIPGSALYNALIELQERRKDPWNRDIEALKKHLKTGKAIVIFPYGATPYAQLIVKYNEKFYYRANSNEGTHGEPIAWLPWEG